MTKKKSILGSPFKKILVPLTRKEKVATYWARFIEIFSILIFWLMRKLNPYAEKVLAEKSSKKWHFKPIPRNNALSENAINYKKEKLIEINKSTEIQTRVIDFITFSDIIDTFPFSEIGKCGCRTIVKHCDCPTETCLMMRWAVTVSKSLPNHTKYQLSSREDIEEVVDLCDKYALIHMTLQRPDLDHVYTICSCCDCCCFSFSEWKKNATPYLVKSKYIAKIDLEKCKGCYHCINYRCRFRAILKVNEDGTVIDPKKEDKERFQLKWPKWSENRRGWGNQIRRDPASWEKIRAQHPDKWFAQIDPNRCFGCGNCASPKYGCPEGAIKLYPRE